MILKEMRFEPEENREIEGILYEAANKLFEFIEQLWKKKNSNLAICEDNYQHFRHVLEQKLDSSDKQILQDLIDIRDEIEKQKYLAILILGLKLANG